MKHTHFFWPVHFEWFGEDTRLFFGAAPLLEDRPTFYQCKCGSQGFPL